MSQVDIPKRRGVYFFCSMVINGQTGRLIIVFCPTHHDNSPKSRRFHHANQTEKNNALFALRKVKRETTYRLRKHHQRKFLFDPNAHINKNAFDQRYY